MRRALVPAALFVLFVVMPIAELAVIIWVGSRIGVLATLAILILDSMLGAWLLRGQGRTAWRRFVGALDRGRIPAREVLDGGLVIFGAALLLTPGFITDVLGLLLLLPPSRAVFRGLLAHRFGRALVTGVSSRAFGGRRRAPDAERGPRPRQSYDVEGTAVDVESPRLPG